MGSFLEIDNEKLLVFLYKTKQSRLYFSDIVIYWAQFKFFSTVKCLKHFTLPFKVLPRFIMSLKGLLTSSIF